MARAFAILFLLIGGAFSFCSNSPSLRIGSESKPNHYVLLQAAKKRRRKQPPGAPTMPDSVEDSDEGTDDDLAVLSEVAKYEFKPDAFISSDDRGGGFGIPGSDPLQLPDIKDQIRKKEMEEEMARIEEEEEESRPRIKRSDKVAFARLLEQQPYADSDPSYFVKEEYNTVSALLGEGAASFLNIPPGPLQVGHFIGALVIVLMAFVEYPGFPLTNLPTPLRGCFQSGLGVVYLINTVLAVLAALKAGDRGTSPLLWAVKCFSVGGLAYDQLTQLPTKDEIAAAKARKGARAAKNLK